jgi:hypothetical protein
LIVVLVLRALGILTVLGLSGWWLFYRPWRGAPSTLWYLRLPLWPVMIFIVPVSINTSHWFLALRIRHDFFFERIETHPVTWPIVPSTHKNTSRPFHTDDFDAPFPYASLYNELLWHVQYRRVRHSVLHTKRRWSMDLTRQYRYITVWYPVRGDNLVLQGNRGMHRRDVQA